MTATTEDSTRGETATDRESKGEDDGSDHDDGVSREVVFEMLSNQRRRFVVHHLLAADGASDLRDLSRHVAAWENGKQTDEVTSEERRRAYNALQQVHLPKMDDAGLVEYDAGRGTVTASETLDELQVYLEIVPGNEIPWSQYYLLVGLLCASVALAAWTDLYPFGLIPETVLLGGAALLLTCSGLAHLYHSRRMRLGGRERPPRV